MGITRRWEPSDPEYKRAVEYVNTRKYRHALERLHKLVVQRLFELHKMNLSNTGYKMRTHISNALQRRSKAIRNAVKSYNTAAVALNPPRDTLDWSKVSHYTFLDQFNILQDTRHSVFDQPWAKPVNRTLMKQHRRIARAREEIACCNIEIRRLHTHIIDEGKFFDTTYDLEGFTGNRTPGTRQGSSSHIISQAPSNSHAPDPGSDGEDEDDDEFTEELGNVFDYLSNMSLQ
ncbi:hypothetical protein BT96DRAFT_959393 [Gymnopus androsaceus JB14]|uniref:Uncharacterized protein n=1 Tax=Gymnopus androsaceus JB14 TaxID=1447944 RepID=A0A6A4H316_9AGAR|nr:hypothetical protein BT96DRAFT_959393 [Gymnopus androsaceus JB14]